MWSPTSLRIHSTVSKIHYWMIGFLSKDMWFYPSDHACIKFLKILCFWVIVMARNLRKCLGVVATATIAIVATTIYFRNGVIFQDFPSKFLMVYCMEISRQNLITKVSWIKLLANPCQSKDLNRILGLFKKLKMIHKPTKFDKW